MDCIGAYTRGKTLEEAESKVVKEIDRYYKWLALDEPKDIHIKIERMMESALDVQDADSDIIFDDEQMPLTIEEYEKLKALALKSAKDFLEMYNSIIDKSKTVLPARKTFYGMVPRTATEMYMHTKNVNEYYFAEIDVLANNSGDIYQCRKQGFAELEKQPNFLENTTVEGSYGEKWSVRKVIRRFIWHDCIHAKAMYRMAMRLNGEKNINNTFFFEI